MIDRFDSAIKDTHPDCPGESWNVGVHLLLSCLGFIDLARGSHRVRWEIANPARTRGSKGVGLKCCHYVLSVPDEPDRLVDVTERRPSEIPVGATFFFTLPSRVAVAG